MQHYIDNHQTLIEYFKEYPIMASFISIVGIGLGYSAEEFHFPLWLMQTFQITVWSTAILVSLIPIFDVCKNRIFPWIKSFKKK